MTNEPPPPRKRGCFFYGCIALIVTVLVLAIGAVVLVRFAKSKVDQVVAEYTDPTPMQLEKGDASPAKLNAVQTRIDAFRQGLASGQPQELAFTADELNTLLAGQPDLQEFANMVYVIIEGDQLKGNISYPLPDVPPFKLKGRYLNGLATFDVKVTKGDADIHIRDITTKGKPLPPEVLDQLRKVDLADHLIEDQQAASAIRQIDSVEVKDGKLIIRSQ